MLAESYHSVRKVMLAVGYTDLRKGVDGLSQLILSLAGQVTQLTQNVEFMMEQIRLANQRQFGRRTERINQIDGQLSFLRQRYSAGQDDKRV